MRTAFDLREPYAARDLGDRNVAVLERAVRRPAWPHGWHDLQWISQTDVRDALRIYARLGLHPIAVHGLTANGCTCARGAKCEAAGKHPVDAAWQKQTLNVDRVDESLIANWRFNIGIRTGLQPNGRFLVVVDVDGPRDLLEPFEREHGTLPPTLTARTGRGLHLLYWLPEGRELRNRVGVVPGVDLRGSGGQIVAAPSRHKSGARYEWLEVREPAVLK